MAKPVRFFTSDFLRTYREMLDYIRKDRSGRPKRQSIIKTAESLLSQAEILRNRVNEGISSTVSLYFGRIGFNYDFRLKVKNVKKLAQQYRIELLDERGRSYSVSLEPNEIISEIKFGDILTFRGKVLAHQLFRKEPITLVQVVSGLEIIATINLV